MNLMPCKDVPRHEVLPVPREKAHDFVYRYSLQSNELPIQLGQAWSVQRMAVAAIGVVTIGLLDVKEQLGIRSPPINDSAWRHDQRWLS
ncbi:hypothetical protein WJX84_012197 [Apatococcus fuscideae]|uniref:Uncharacterized protein n=1 Tax=Apatococcus fuscideae TaxID=2026836 RepID=A0AAW1T493_9CHLO